MEYIVLYSKYLLKIQGGQFMKTIIFDMYGVILKESKGNFIPYIYSHFPNTDKALIKSLFPKAQLGEIDSDEFMHSLGFEDVLFHKKDYIQNHLTFDSTFIPFAEQYKDKYEFALLSNDVLAWNKYILQYHDLSHYFKTCIVSAEVHYRKPEKEIYEIALSRLAAQPNECIYIDNSVKNLLVAEELGIGTILFNRDNETYHGKTVYSFEGLDGLINKIS